MSRRKDGSFVPRECKLVSVAMEWINFHERTIAIQSELVHDSRGVGALHAWPGGKVGPHGERY